MTSSAKDLKNLNGSDPNFWCVDIVNSLAVRLSCSTAFCVVLIIYIHIAPLQRLGKKDNLLQRTESVRINHTVQDDNDCESDVQLPLSISVYLSHVPIDPGEAELSDDRHVYATLSSQISDGSQEQRWQGVRRVFEALLAARDTKTLHIHHKYLTPTDDVGAPTGAQ